MENSEEDHRGRLQTPEATHQQQRRGSHLLAAAGINYEQRRKLSHQKTEEQGRVFQQGNQVGVVFSFYIMYIHESYKSVRGSTKPRRLVSFHLIIIEWGIKNGRCVFM
jgi:hypothetical protein